MGRPETVILWAVLAVGLSSPLRAQPPDRIAVVNGREITEDDVPIMWCLGDRPPVPPDVAQEYVVGLAKEAYRQRFQGALRPTKEEVDALHRVNLRCHEELMNKVGPSLRDREQACLAALKQKGLSRDAARKLRDELGSVRGRLKPPDRPLARARLDSWKLERHLYDHYGGGRIRGLTAHDATRRFLEELESEGHLQVTDPDVRRAMTEEWSADRSTSSLIEDEALIRAQFLEAEGAPPASDPPLKAVKKPKKK